MSGAMVTEQVIAKAIGVDIRTLKKHFKFELEHGAEIVRATLLGAQAVAAKDGSSPAATRLVLDSMVAPAAPKAARTVATPSDGTDAAPAPRPARRRGKGKKDDGDTAPPPGNPWSKVLK